MILRSGEPPFRNQFSPIIGPPNENLNGPKKKTGKISFFLPSRPDNRVKTPRPEKYPPQGYFSESSRFIG